MCARPDAALLSGLEWGSRGRSTDPGSLFGHKITNRKWVQTSLTAPLPPFVYNEGGVEVKSPKLHQRLLLLLHSVVETFYFRPRFYVLMWKVFPQECKLKLKHFSLTVRGKVGAIKFLSHWTDLTETLRKHQLDEHLQLSDLSKHKNDYHSVSFSETELKLGNWDWSPTLWKLKLCH